MNVIYVDILFVVNFFNMKFSTGFFSIKYFSIKIFKKQRESIHPFVLPAFFFFKTLQKLY